MFLLLRLFCDSPVSESICWLYKLLWFKIYSNDKLLDASSCPRWWIYLEHAQLISSVLSSSLSHIFTDFTVPKSWDLIRMPAAHYTHHGTFLITQPDCHSECLWSDMNCSLRLTFHDPMDVVLVVLQLWVQQNLELSFCPVSRAAHNICPLEGKMRKCKCEHISLIKCKLIIITVNIFLSNAARHDLYFFVMKHIMILRHPHKNVV